MGQTMKDETNTMSTALKSITTRKTVQTERANKRQVKNNAGGYVYEVSLSDAVRRFLILGVEGNTFYQSGNALAKENAERVLEMAETDPEGLVTLIHEVSTKGLAPKQDATLFALAAAMSVPEAVPYVQSVFNEVVRTASQLFTFVGYVKQFRGWGRALRNTVAQWYESRDLENLGYQVSKYRNRNGYTHRDVLRLSHPTASGERNNLFAYLANKEHDSEALPVSVRGYLAVSKAESAKDVVALMAEFDLSWEMIPSSLLNDAEVWKTLLAKGVPMTALIRQLPRLTRLGVFDDKAVLSAVVKQLTNKAYLHKSRIHPMSVLLALKTYESGYSERGSSTWRPNVKIVDALDEAFYLSFANVEPANKRTMIALDVSESMTWDKINGVTPREAAAAMSLITLATEDDVETVAFTNGVSPLALSKRQRLDDIMRKMNNLLFGRTDCAAPILYALKNKIEIDTFIVYTDSETWQGDIHVDQALKMYREQMGIEARMVVAAFTATNFTIGDPEDNNVLNIAGLDASIGTLIANFSARRF